MPGHAPYFNFRVKICDTMVACYTQSHENNIDVMPECPHPSGYAAYNELNKLKLYFNKSQCEH